MLKGTFGKIQVNMLLGDSNLPRLLFNEDAWDDLRLHSPKPTTLICDVFDKLGNKTKDAIIDVLKAISGLSEISTPTRRFSERQQRMVKVVVFDDDETYSVLEGCQLVLFDSDYPLGEGDTEMSWKDIVRLKHGTVDCISLDKIVDEWDQGY